MKLGHTTYKRQTETNAMRFRLALVQPNKGRSELRHQRWGNPDPLIADHPAHIAWFGDSGKPDGARTGAAIANGIIYQSRERLAQQIHHPKDHHRIGRL